MGNRREGQPPAAPLSSPLEGTGDDLGREQTVGVHPEQPAAPPWEMFSSPLPGILMPVLGQFLT